MSSDEGAPEVLVTTAAEIAGLAEAAERAADALKRLACGQEAVMYRAGLAVTSGLDDQLRAELRQVDADMSAIAAKIIAEVRAKLGSAPPA